MGYTHYWNHPEAIEKKTFDSIRKDFKKVLPKFKDLLGDYEGKGKPEITQDEIVFNGIGEDAHETMSLSSKKGTNDFCKTAQKPYDIAVTALLIIAKHHMGNKINVGSDGDIEDWKPANDLCQEILGYQGWLK